MSGCFAHRLITVSAAVAAAGVLACSAAVLEVLLPRGFIAAFLIGLVLVGFAVIGAMLGFTWLCDRLEGHFPQPLKQAAQMANNATVRSFAIQA